MATENKKDKPEKKDYVFRSYPDMNFTLILRGSVMPDVKFDRLHSHGKKPPIKVKFIGNFCVINDEIAKRKHSTAEEMVELMKEHHWYGRKIKLVDGPGVVPDKEDAKFINNANEKLSGPEVTRGHRATGDLKR